MTPESFNNHSEGVLQGVRILDFSRYAAGPHGSMLLADMGAEVIKVEKPGGNDDRGLGPFAPNGQNLLTLILARNKKNITLSLRSEKGEHLLRELVRRSDVVMHNFTAGSPEADMLDYTYLKQINPTIILVAVTGYGQSGPYAQRPCLDNIAQALSGAMSFAGFPGDPPTRDPLAVVDMSSGVYAALGTMLALYHRQRTGVGQMVDVALLAAAVSCISAQGVIAEYKFEGRLRPQQGNQGYFAFTNTFLAKDGWVIIMVFGNSLWRRFTRAIGKDELGQDPRFKDDISRAKNYHLAHPIVSAWVAERTRDEVLQVLDAARIPCGRVNSVADVENDPQVKAREMVINMDYPGIGELPVPGIVVKLSQTPAKIEKPAASLGEHNTEIYGGLLGLSTNELTRLEKAGVI